MPDEIVIVGAGIAGLVTGLALARAGHRVTILERDGRLPEGGPDDIFFHWNRRGVAQFRHPHAFLAAMTSRLAKHFPELIDECIAAGARRLSFEDLLPSKLADTYTFAPGDERIWLLLCRRATFEMVLRRYTEAQPNISIRARTNVIGIITEQKGKFVLARGLTLAGDEQVTADIVIDAGGRRSPLKAWLEASGGRLNREEHDTSIVYYTRHFQLKPGMTEPPRDPDERSTGDLGYLKYGLFPGDNGHFATILCILETDAELRAAVRDGEKFNAICRQIPGLARWIDEGRVAPTTEPFGFAGIRSHWTDFMVGGKPFALNYFAVGDAAMHTNPLYGRGCSTSIMQSLLLADAIDSSTDPVVRAKRYATRSGEVLRPIFEISIREDIRGLQRARSILSGEITPSARSLRRWFRLALADALSAAARENLHVFRGAMRSFNLLERPGAFVKEWRVQLTLLRYLLRGRRRNAQSRLQRGPDRDALLRSLSHQAGHQDAA